MRFCKVRFTNLETRVSHFRFGFHEIRSNQFLQWPREVVELRVVLCLQRFAALCCAFNGSMDWCLKLCLQWLRVTESCNEFVMCLQWLRTHVSYIASAVLSNWVVDYSGNYKFKFFYEQILIISLLVFVTRDQTHNHSLLPLLLNHSTKPYISTNSNLQVKQSPQIVITNSQFWQPCFTWTYTKEFILRM